jgi:hypothetical protein
MPKLNKAMAKKVEDAEESDGFAPVPEGLYAVQLTEVTVGEGPKGPYWTWIYEIPADAEVGAGKRLWNTTSLSENAMGMPGGFKRTFAAFGVDTTTDTDELCGEQIIAQLEVVTQEKGKNAGRKINQIVQLFPLDYEPEGDEEPF